MSIVEYKEKIGQETSTNGNDDKDDDRSIMAASLLKHNGKMVNKGAASASSLKLLLLVLMVLQNSSTVLVGRHTRSSVAQEDLYVVNHLILITECTKFVLSCMLEHVQSGNLCKSFRRHVVQTPWDALKILVPALLYLVQNSLLYIALGNLSAPLFQVTYQAKLVTTALVSVCMLHRSYSTQQWICLVVLSVGVAIVVLGEEQSHQSHQSHQSQNASATAADKPAAQQQSLTLGLTAVTIACLSSALAGVYFEKVLKRPNHSNTTTTTSSSAAAGGGGGTIQPASPPAPVSLWMRNIQMAFFSVLIAMIQNWYTTVFGAEEKLGGSTTGTTTSQHDATTRTSSYFHGFTAWVWILVGLQAGGGLLVAAVIKYADNVLKGLATGVSVVVATVCSMVLFGTPLSMQFSMGAMHILGAVYFFSNKLPGSSSSGGGKSIVEMKPLVLPK